MSSQLRRRFVVTIGFWDGKRIGVYIGTCFRSDPCEHPSELVSTGPLRLVNALL